MKLIKLTNKIIENGMNALGISVLIIFGMTYKLVNSVVPPLARPLRKFIYLFFRKDGSRKKSFSIILMPLLILSLMSPTLISASASAPTATKTDKSNLVKVEKKVAKTKEKATRVKQEVKEEQEVKEVKKTNEAPKKTDNREKIILPNDYRGEFIKSIMGDAIELGKKYDVYPSVMMAQAIIESDWGRSGLTQLANNYFGIKAAKDANGNPTQKAVNMLTTEYYDGVPCQIYDYFAAYDSAYGSLESNAKLITEGIDGAPNFYSGTWRSNAPTYAEAANALTNKYATDPNYGPVLVGVIETYELYHADK